MNMSIVALVAILVVSVQRCSSVTSGLRERKIRQYLALIILSIHFSLIVSFTSLQVSLHSSPKVAKSSCLTVTKEFGRGIHQHFRPSVLSGSKTYFRFTIPARSSRLCFLTFPHVPPAFIPVVFTAAGVTRILLRRSLIEVPCFALNETNKNTSLGDLGEIGTSMREIKRFSFSYNVTEEDSQVEVRRQPKLHADGPDIHLGVTSLENDSAMTRSLKRSCQQRSWNVAKSDSFEREGSHKYGRNDDEIQVLGFFLLAND